MKTEVTEDGGRNSRYPREENFKFIDVHQRPKVRDGIDPSRYTDSGSVEVCKYIFPPPIFYSDVDLLDVECSLYDEGVG